MYQKSDIACFLARGQKSVNKRGSIMATIEDDDERLLNRIGYTQDLRRHFSKWSTLSYAVSVLGVLGSVPATFGSPLSLGGPAAASVWAWFFGSIMAQIISSSGVASVGYTVSQLILAAASMNSHFDHTTGIYAYSPSALQTALLSWLILVILGVICSLTTKHLHQIVTWFMPINVLASIAICIALLVLTPNKQSATWVFTHFTNGSGWGTPFSFFLSFLSVAWTMTDYDGTTHMSEETHDAAIRGPMAIRWAVTISGVVGWMLTVTLCFCATDLDAIINSPTGMPAAQIFLNAADTRMAYAFARDGALPFSNFWAKVNPYTHTPVNSVWLVVILTCALNTIAIGSTATIVAIFNITAPALDMSYAAVIVARNIYASRVKFIPGPYTLGVWQKPLNVIACTWVLFISTVLMFPTIRPVTIENMNYAVVVGAGIGVFSLGWWRAGARKTYTGPKTKDLIQSIASEEGNYVSDPRPNYGSI
ncbi:hypothetical protein DID88_002497 [Monilinia fructigena]|uniref:Uncharacterized protein n=1 Tax=Monilinia fructigena TaxID=38457 RepID=A0A395IQY2_9HELO|nr:hypothetical protein DID88_002497 [Monilinia fructigena]